MIADALATGARPASFTAGRPAPETRARDARAGKRTRGLDPITARAVASTLSAPPDERYLRTAGLSRRQLARRLGVSHARVGDVFADAIAYRRLSPEWAERLAGVIGATGPEIDALFGIARAPAADGASPAGAREDA